MIPMIAAATATMAVKIHVLLAWTAMDSGTEASGPEPSTPEVSVALYTPPAAEPGTTRTNESMALRSGARTTVRVMASGSDPPIGTQRTDQPAGIELSRTNVSAVSPTLTSRTVPGTTPPAVVFSEIAVGRRTALRARPRSAIATSSIHQPPRVGMFPAVALNRT